MDIIKREFYEIYGAAKLLEISISDLWHLIEVGKIEASFRKIIADSTIYHSDDVTIDDYFAASHTFLIPHDVATIIAATGSCKTDEALLLLAEPREELSIDRDGNEFIWLRETHKFTLNSDLELEKGDVVITQIAIEKYINRFVNLKKSETPKVVTDEKLLSVRTENNYLRLIMRLANGIVGFNPTKPYEAAQLIIDETEIKISKQAIADYISKAYELEMKERD